MKISFEKCMVGACVGGILVFAIASAQANTMHNVATTTNDAKITSVVKTKIAYAASKSEFQGKRDITVTTNKGVVTLDGCISNYQDKGQIDQLVHNTTDVVGLVDNLALNPSCDS